MIEPGAKGSMQTLQDVYGLRLRNPLATAALLARIAASIGTRAQGLAAGKATLRNRSEFRVVWSKVKTQIDDGLSAHEVSQGDKEARKVTDSESE